MAQSLTPVDINRAGRDELSAVPGMGPWRADMIVQWRDLHGPFEDVEELRRLWGFSPQAMDQLRDRLRV